MKKLYALLLVVIMLAASLVACNDNTTNSEPSDQSKGNESTASVGEASEAVSEPENTSCWLPEKKWNTTLTWATAYNEEDSTSDVRYYEIWCEEDLGDIVSQSVVERSRWLESEYGISIEMVYNPKDGVVSYAELCAESDMPLDVITGAAFAIAPTLEKGYFYDFKEINAQYNDGKGWLRLDQDYWDQNSMRDYSFANRVFMLTGDICLYDDENTWAMFFNKGMAQEYGIESPYKTVKDGNWTIDLLHEYCKQVTMATGDKLTWVAEDHNKWGMVTQSFDCIMFMMGCGQSMVAKDTNDLPYLRIDEQRNIDVAQKVVSMLIDENFVGVADFYGFWSSGVYDVETQMFANGDALFMPHSMAMLNSQKIKESEVDIGVIPMPKADEIQEDYSSSSNVYGLQMVAVPITNTANLEATLYALEAMAWYGQQYVTPQYYEKVLKLQKFRDEDAEEMLDLIFKNRTYDMAIAYNFSDMIQFYNKLLGGRTTDIVSKFDASRQAYQEAIDNAIATFTQQ